ncbi:MAG: zf-TFIIB domain-containing protein [Chlorobia bacterium]|nr:zf-TFIIB domain-containing protein [Fimbriimonadaceae bacterium]
MKCPICVSTDLVMADRNGVEIDYCPQCRGIWLDRGELDKVLSRAGGEGNRWYRDDDDDDDRDDPRNPNRRKRNWLMDIFD